ncbi:MAG: single-stranded DNA-binding protein [Micrococcales bacterium]|nr:single-stranded DNA-binding protein [Micrococcales bacterium]
MSGDTIITVVGNLTGDPELRFTPSGAAVANFTIASTPRVFDRGTQQWKDGDTLFMRCSIWREAAENVAETLVKGARVIAQGRLVQRSYETRDGEKRTQVELQVEEVGPSLRYASAKVTRNARSQSAGGYGTGEQTYGAPVAGADPFASGGVRQAATPPQAPPPQAPPAAPAAPAAGPSGYAVAQPDDPWANPGVSSNASEEPPF